MSTLEEQVSRELIRKDKLKVRLEKSIKNDVARMHGIREKMDKKKVLLEKLTEEAYKEKAKIEIDRVKECNA